MAMIRALIVDDEPLARGRIRDLLHIENDIEVIGESGDGFEALELIRARRPDLLFLDVRMPTLSGVKILRRLSAEEVPYVIFTTAYADYAVEAFALDAVDYLMKPIDKPRFKQALYRARRQIASAVKPAAADLEQTIARIAEAADRLSYSVPAKLTVKDGRKLRVLDPREITYAHSDGDYLQIYTVDGGRSMIRGRMHQFERRLEDRLFRRVSRSALLNFDHVTEIRQTARGDYEFILSTGERLLSGRTYRESIRAWLNECWNAV